MLSADAFWAACSSSTDDMLQRLHDGAQNSQVSQDHCVLEVHFWCSPMPARRPGGRSSAVEMAMCPQHTVHLVPEALNTLCPLLQDVRVLEALEPVALLMKAAPGRASPSSVQHPGACLLLPPWLSLQAGM